MEQQRHLKAKICLVGEAAVGKTSLIRRFVQSQFSDDYLTTIGVKVSKKRLDVSSGELGAHSSQSGWVGAVEKAVVQRASCDVTAGAG